MPNWVYTLCGFIKDHVPIFYKTLERERDRLIDDWDESVKQLQKQADDKIEGYRRQYLTDLNDAKKQLNAIVENLTDVVFYKDTEDRYSVTIHFSTELTRGLTDRKDMAYIAEAAAMRVRRDIESCKFAQSARDFERKLMKKLDI